MRYREVTLDVPKEFYETMDKLYDAGVKEQLVPSTADRREFYVFCLMTGAMQIEQEIKHRQSATSLIVEPSAGIKRPRLV